MKELENLNLSELELLLSQINNKLNDCNVYPYDFSELKDILILKSGNSLNEEKIIIYLKSLYNKGLISYPFTGCKKIPMDNYQSCLGTILYLIQENYVKKPLKLINDIDVLSPPPAFSYDSFEHSAIIPLIPKNKDFSIEKEELFILKLIVKRFLKTFKK